MGMGPEGEGVEDADRVPPELADPLPLPPSLLAEEESVKVGVGERKVGVNVEEGEMVGEGTKEEVAPPLEPDTVGVAAEEREREEVPVKEAVPVIQTLLKALPVAVLEDRLEPLVEGVFSAEREADTLGEGVMVNVLPSTPPPPKDVAVASAAGRVGDTVGVNFSSGVAVEMLRVGEEEEEMEGEGLVVSVTAEDTLVVGVKVGEALSLPEPARDPLGDREPRLVSVWEMEGEDETVPVPPPPIPFPPGEALTERLPPPPEEGLVDSDPPAPAGGVGVREGLGEGEREMAGVREEERVGDGEGVAEGEREGERELLGEGEVERVGGEEAEALEAVAVRVG